jgi:serine/threonine-protein kinase
MAALGVIAVDGTGASPPAPPTAAPWHGGEDGAGMPEEPYGRRRRWWPWLVALLILLVTGGAAAAYLLTRPAKADVPTVTGQGLNVARTELQNAGFGVQVISAPSSQSAGTVIGQDPTAGAKVDKGSTVTLTVSSGPGTTTVPSVQGLSLAQAKHKLRRAGLRIGRVVSQSSPTVPAGDVIGTDPASGQNPTVGTQVTLKVSTGKPTAVVPPVVGDSESAAEDTLRRAGFTVTATAETSSAATPGNVISQTPGANTTAPVGSNVALVIAKAPTTAKVPEVKGDTAAGARSTLTAAGFKVVKQTKMVTKAKNAGIVVSQSPGGGATVKKGSTVTIVVGHYVAPPPPTTSTTTTSTTTPSTTTPTTTS